MAQLHKRCMLPTHDLWPLPKEGPAASPFPLPGGWLLAKAAALTGCELPCISMQYSAADSLVDSVMQQADTLASPAWA